MYGGIQMKYKGIYWRLFSPFIHKSIESRFGKDLANQTIRKGKEQYRKLLAQADDLGPGNPMASNAYFAYVFSAAWLGSDKQISPQEMAQVMTDVLSGPLLKFYFGLTDLNKKPKKWYNAMKKYEKWYQKHGKDYPVNWIVQFDENKHAEGSYYCFTRCPICEFCQRIGIGELMPALCATDEVMFKLQHGRLHRKYTIAKGDPICDYWVTGDQAKNRESIQ